MKVFHTIREAVMHQLKSSPGSWGPSAFAQAWRDAEKTPTVADTVDESTLGDSFDMNAGSEVIATRIELAKRYLEQGGI